MSKFNFKDFTISRKCISDEDDIVIAIDKNGDKIAELYIHHEDENYMTAHQVDVDEEHRRKGIATAMYEFQEEMTGKKFIKSPYQSVMGELFWSQKKKSFGE